ASEARTVPLEIREYQLKAAFVSSVMKFVEWPAPAVPSVQAPMTMVVLGRRGGDVVAAALTGATWKGRPIAVIPADGTTPLPSCHVLFITAEAATAQRGALEAVAGRSVLTISETESPMAIRAVVTLAIVDTKIRFDVDMGAADAHQLRLSANLLSLARRVVAAPTPGGGA
ncbi:MAG: YfiR family protein, partial [Acidobacteria bacterium]|nr:YfiR family protein [Acidobacteriota bacterium]